MGHTGQQWPDLGLGRASEKLTKDVKWKPALHPCSLISLTPVTVPATKCWRRSYYFSWPNIYQMHTVVGLQRFVDCFYLFSYYLDIYYRNSIGSYGNVVFSCLYLFDLIIHRNFFCNFFSSWGICHHVLICLRKDERVRWNHSTLCNIWNGGILNLDTKPYFPCHWCTVFLCNEKVMSSFSSVQILMLVGQYVTYRTAVFEVDMMKKAAL